MMDTCIFVSQGYSSLADNDGNCSQCRIITAQDFPIMLSVQCLHLNGTEPARADSDHLVTKV